MQGLMLQKNVSNYTRAPDPVINGVNNPCKWPYKRETEVVTPVSGVITPFITGRGPPCTLMVEQFRQMVEQDQDIKWLQT